MLLLSGLFTVPAYAWPEVDTMNMCNQAVQVTRAYQGGAKGWVDRDSHASAQKMQVFARNCPQVKAPVKAYKKKVYKKKIPRTSKTCKKCYRKGFHDGYRAASNKRIYKKKLRRSGYRSHAEEVADCKRVDWANNASRTTVVATWK